jgi:ABC-2 type transport system permease protein
VSWSAFFQRLRWRLLRNTFGTLVSRSPGRLITIVICSVLIWAGVYLVSYLGFRLLKVELRVPLDGAIIGTLFNLGFTVLLALLLASTSLILSSSLFASTETDFLMSTPAPADQVFAFKFQGAVAFSSWAFVLLVSPILIAYGLTLDGTPWYFYALLPFFFLGFVLLPGSLGGLVCLLVVRLVPRRRKQLLLQVIVLAAAGMIWWLYHLVKSLRGPFGAGDWVNDLMGEFSLLRTAVVPARWMSDGLIEAALGEPDAFYHLALIWTNGLVAYLATAWAAARWYRSSYNQAATGGDLRRRYGGGRLDPFLAGLLGWLAPQTRLLIIKDFRTFRRDPAQWAQILIFVGLASLYFTYVGQFYQQDTSRSYSQKSIISLMNLAATAFLLCAYTGRFIYPLISLEGRKFWILGLLPLERNRLLMGKFAYSAILALAVGEFVVVFSDVMLGIPWLMVGLHALTVAAVALGLSGLSVGLGAAMPNFKETNPSKLAVGFGGTLNLVAGLSFLIVVILLMAVPWHMAMVFQGPDPRLKADVARWLALGAAIGVILGGAAVVVPLRVGMRALRRMEF